MKAFFKSRQHSKAGSVIPHESTRSADLPDGEEQSPRTPGDYTPRENAFDTARRLHEKLHKKSESSYYSCEQDDEQGEDDTKPLPMLLPSPTDTIPNASYSFWSTQRSEMWVCHVASSKWPTAYLADGASNKKAFTDPLHTLGDASKPKIRPGNDLEAQVEKSFDKKPEHEAENKAKVKSDTAKLTRGPKLTLQISESMRFRIHQPYITSEERVEWKRNMF